MTPFEDRLSGRCGSLGARAVPFGQFGDVRSGHEGLLTGPGQGDDPHRRIGLQVRQGFSQFFFKSSM